MGLPAFRSAGDPADPAVLLVHGYPESSHMWRVALDALAESGLYAVAPDLPGFGNSEPGAAGTNTWERHVETLEALRVAEGLDRVALVGHDWGGLIGLRWACDHADAVWAVVASDTGFFPDGRWHGMADAMRTPGQGEELVDGMTLEGLTGLLGSISTGIGADDAREYFKAFADEPRRRGQLELYRSGDFEKLAPYEGGLGALGVPTLLLWGEDDFAAPVAGARRFEREIPGAEVVVLDGTGHFVVEDAPDRYAEELVRFLKKARPGTAR
jgi:haloalkane dehalogenase